MCEKKKVVILGSGNASRHIAKELLSKNFEVVCADSVIENGITASGIYYDEAVFVIESNKVVPSLDPYFLPTDDNSRYVKRNYGQDRWFNKFKRK